MDFILKRRVLISMLFLGMTLLGYISYNKLSVELIPNAQLPFLVVQVGSTMEMDPAYIESQAVIPIEGAIGTLEDIEDIESNITSSYGAISVYYNQKVDIKYAGLKLQEKINSISASLPEEFVVNVIKVDLEQLTNQFMTLQIRGEGGVDRIRNITDKHITPKLENITGIAGVQTYGGQENSIEVRLNEEACKALGITMTQIRSLLNNNSENKTLVGKVVDGSNKMFVNITSDYSDISEIGNITVSSDGPVLLKDIAEIFYGVKEVTSYSRVNGMESVTLNLVNDNQANQIDLSHMVTTQVESLNRELAQQNIEIVVQSNSAETMENNINQIINLAIVGGCLAILILWFFLRNIRLVSIIALSLPISVFSAFNFFYAADITVNSLTLVGIALAVGMLVDNSVVVLENIYRLAGTGKSSEKAVKQGTTEVWRAIIASTLTTVVVFLPFVFFNNFMVKIIGKNIGVSIISTLLISLAVALLLIPMAANTLLANGKKTNSEIFKKLSIHNRLIQAYHLVLKTCMRHPATTVIGALTAFFIALLVSLTLSISASQEVDTTSFSLYVTMPSGSTIERTDAVVTELESLLESLPEKGDIVSRIEEDEASVTINLPEDWDKHSKRTLAEIKNDINNRAKRVTTAEITLGSSATSGSNAGNGGMSMDMGNSFMRLLGIGGQSESVVIKGENFTQMKTVAEDIKNYVEELKSVEGASTNVQNNSPEVQLQFDMDYMNRNNFSLANLSAALATFGQEYSSGATFKQGVESYDIIITYDKDNKEDTDKTIDDLRSLEVTNSANVVMSMNELSDIVLSSGMGSIHRENQEKVITVTYSFTSAINESKDLLENARKEVDALVTSLSIPSGIAIEVVHEEDMFKDFYILIAIAFVLIYMILAAVFESLSIPLVLLLSIPLAALGSLLALILTQNSLLNANTLMGFLILLGIVVNNGIILIDYTNNLRRQGNRRSRALMMAGMARIRPILITASTTVVAMIPMAMGKSEYASIIGASFAITVIGGLAVSSLLTLVFVPTFYSGLENALQWFKGLTWKNKLMQFVVFALLITAIYTKVDKFWWQLITIILSIILVPASTWFVMNSLKRAGENIIPPGEAIHIRIQNLVKIYDRESRWSREWKAGKKIRERLGLEKHYHSLSDMNQMLWQLPIFAFLVYFTYFYLRAGFWIFFFSITTWFFLFAIWRPFKELLDNIISGGGSSHYGRLMRAVDFTVLWIIPLFNIIMFQKKWDNIAVVIILAVVWYIPIVIYKTSQKINIENIDIQRLDGYFKKLKKTFYTIVMAVPLIGKTKKPFKALNSVSMDIGSGMFGLLGPNGAGKTTLMRIICGIYEQSYGKIWINGFDTQEKREELQGLIGYLPQEFGTYENMTAREYLNYQAMLKGIKDVGTRNGRVDYVLTAVHMEDHGTDKISSFSGGMKQRIGIAQILLHLPRILVVDEPTAGLDPRERIRFRNLLVELSRERVVIFSTHIIEDISSSCNHVAVMRKGTLAYYGKPIDMTKEATGHVWQFTIPINEFNSFIANHLVVHHMTEGSNVRLRVIAENKPHDDAINVSPNLEDAYLWLLRADHRIINNELIK